MVPGDFNDDGLMDLATIDGKASVLLGTTAELSPQIVDFGMLPIGVTSPPAMITLTNGSTAALTISSIVTGGDFGETNNCGTSLASGASCTINVTWTPSIVGDDFGSLEVTDDALGSPQSVTLFGEGGGPRAIFSPTSWIFPQQQVGTASIPESFTLENVGNESLTISGITLSGLGTFSQKNNCPSALAPDGSCTFTVEFRPAAAGMFKGTLSVSDNAFGSPQTVSLTGTGAGFVVTPFSLSFGNVMVGQSSGPQNITVTNVSKSALRVASIQILKGRGSVEFSQTNNCGSSLGAGASCSIGVIFSPRMTGFVQVDVQIVGGGGIWSVAGSGTGD